MVIVDLDRLASAAGRLGVVEECGILGGDGVLLLAPGRWPTAPEVVARNLAGIPAVTVLLADPASVPVESTAVVDAVDLCLSSTAQAPTGWIGQGGPGCEAGSGTRPSRSRRGLGDVARVVAEHTLAAYALVALTRTSQRLSIVDAIWAESATYSTLLGSNDYGKWLADRPVPRLRTEPAEPVLVDLAHDTLSITLHRPHVRNAVNRTLRDGLVAALELAEAMPEVRVELRGSGPCFSSGGDLAEFGEVEDPATAHAVRATRHPALALARVADRTTAYVHGACVGAGVELAALAGCVVADPGATFRLPEVAMGLVPGAGGTCSLVRRIGRQRANWLMLTGAEIDAPTAAAWGLVDEIAPVNDAGGA